LTLLLRGQNYCRAAGTSDAVITAVCEYFDHDRLPGTHRRLCFLVGSRATRQHKTKHHHRHVPTKFLLSGLREEGQQRLLIEQAAEKLPFCIKASL
jgi:hypothetical protein